MVKSKTLKKSPQQIRNQNNLAITLAAFIVAFSTLVFTFGGPSVFRAWFNINNGNGTTTNIEKYSNFGSVGHKLKGNMAPQEYQQGKTDADKFVDPDSTPKVDDEGNQILQPTNLSQKASSALSESAAKLIADMNTSTANIYAPTDTMPGKHGSKIMNDVKYATKGDGLIRPVDVNGNPLSKELVQLAMFENQDFMFRHEVPEPPGVPHLQDPSQAPQKSHFGPMTYPLVWSKGALGMDVIGESNDTRATISFTGGRPPIFY